MMLSSSSTLSPRSRKLRTTCILQLVALVVFIFAVSTVNLLLKEATTTTTSLLLSSLDAYVKEDTAESSSRRRNVRAMDAHTNEASTSLEVQPLQDPPSAATDKKQKRRRRTRPMGVRTSTNATAAVTSTPSARAQKVTTKETPVRGSSVVVLSTQDSSPSSFLLQTENSTTHHAHNPRYFADKVPLDVLMERGNILTVHTGCSIATFSYQGKRHKYRPLNDCRQHAKSAAALRAHAVTAETAASQVQPYDSIYVPIVKLPHFVNETLPHIQSTFILISGQNSLPPEPIPRHVHDTILSHPKVNKWFLQNLPVHAYDPSHPKLVPFPYGVHPMQPPALLQEMKKTNTKKSNFIYKSWFKRSNNKQERRNVPNGERVSPEIYLSQLHSSVYVLSPNGDRPECHRHYEAIALGTVPITSLDPVYYRHLQGNVVYGEHDWNLTTLQHILPKHPNINRRLMFEEYWMEYVERHVGRPMQWWDPTRNVRCLLEELKESLSDSVVMDTM